MRKLVMNYRKWTVISSALAILLSGCVAVNSLFLSSGSTLNTGEKFEAVPVQQVVPVARSGDLLHRPQLGIAFGGGGVRGFVHLGVIRALDEAGIRADIVTGASAGSIAASLYASGLPYQTIEHVVQSVSESDLADLVIHKQGALKGTALAEWVNEATGHRFIGELPIPLGIAVTDLTNGEALLVVEGDVGKAVQASASVPGAFVPIQVNGAIWVDGGVLSLVPVRFTRAMGADVVIGIDIYCGAQRELKGTLFDNVLSTFHLQSCLLNREEASEADLLIRPRFEPTSVSSFKQRDEAIRIGYEAMKARLPALMNRLDHNTGDIPTF
jgi:NTE family protein